MTDRDRKLIEAARDVFGRYGVAKTTMADIARAAGVARQTLYNAYAGKDEVLRAAVRLSMRESEEAVEAAWADCDSLDAYLEAFFQLVPLGWYDFAQKSPEAAEIMEGVHRVAAEEVAQAARDWSARCQQLLDAQLPADHAMRDQIPAVADYIFASSVNAKYGVENRAQLADRLKVLKLSILSLLA